MEEHEPRVRRRRGLRPPRERAAGGERLRQELEWRLALKRVEAREAQLRVDTTRDHLRDCSSRRIAIYGLVEREGAHVVRVRSPRAREQPLVAAAVDAAEEGDCGGGGGSAARRRRLRWLWREERHLVIDSAREDHPLVGCCRERKHVGLVGAEAGEQGTEVGVPEGDGAGRVAADDGEVREQQQAPDERRLPPASGFAFEGEAVDGLKCAEVPHLEKDGVGWGGGGIVGSWKWKARHEE